MYVGMRRRARTGVGAGIAFLSLLTSLAPARPLVAQEHCTNAPWMDPSMSPDARAGLLVPRMSLDEKISMVHGILREHRFPEPHWFYAGYVPGVPRLCIPALRLADGPAGVAMRAVHDPLPGRQQLREAPGGLGNAVPGGTALPAPIAAAATWDPSLVRAEGRVLGQELWAKGANVALAPMVNIVRLPQGGRTFETLGEDPYLASRLAVADIRGIQDAGVIATVKHLAANNQEASRETISAEVGERVLNEIYLPAFEAAVREGGVGAVMTAYNRVNGTYSSEHTQLLTEILKGRFGFRGFVLSDWGAVHSTVGSAGAGLDMEMPGGRYFGDRLRAAVLDGRVASATLNDKVRRILREIFRFGLFERPQEATPLAVVTSAEHMRVARETAAAGIVLLRNVERTLPLSPPAGSTVAVIGRPAVELPHGGGSSRTTLPAYTETPVEAITRRAAPAGVVYDDGREPQVAATVASDADVAVVFVRDRAIEGAERAELSLPDGQDALVRAVAAANPRTVVVLMTGGPVTMPWLEDVPAVVEAWYPGQEGGSALADVLFGETNPSGRLPVSFPARLEDAPAAGDPARYPGVDDRVRYGEGILVGYRHYDRSGIRPLFAFGHGLSYTRFGYRNLVVTPGRRTARSTASTIVDVTVQNTGPVAGTEVVQLYVGKPSSPALPQAPKELVGFSRVFLEPGESALVRLTLPPRAFSSWDAAGDRWVSPVGTHRLLVGGSSSDIRLRGEVPVVP